MSESKLVLNDISEKLISDFGYSEDYSGEESEQVSSNGNDFEQKIKDEEDGEEEEEEEDKPSSYEYAVDTLNNNPPLLQQQPTPLPVSSSSSSSTSSINIQKSQTNSPVLGPAKEEPIIVKNNENGLFSNILKELPPSIPAPVVVQEQVIIPPKVLFKVKATYPYQAKEVDELTFNKEDLIDVIEGTESEKDDLDEGWLIGIHSQTHNRGLFPENFTKRV